MMRLTPQNHSQNEMTSASNIWGLHSRPDAVVAFSNIGLEQGHVHEKMRP